MNMRQWFQNQITSPCKKAMPVLSFPCISLLNISVKQLIEDSDKQAKGMRAVADRVNSSASVSMMDLSVEAEAFGAEIRFSDDEVPTVIGAIVQDENDADALCVPLVGEKRTGRYVQAIEKACKLITDRPVFAGIIGPFSLAGRLMDVSEALANCIAEPDMVHKTLAKTTQFLIEYAKSYKKAGANGIVMAEPLTGLLSPNLAKEFSEPYVRQIVQAVQEDDFAVVYHNCGNNVVLMADSILATEAMAFHFGNSISIKEMLGHMPKDVVVMGNVDPAAQFRNGTPESIYKETQRIMAECCPEYPNFVISSGCDIPPLSSWDNIDSFFKAVDDYCRTKAK